MTSDDDSSGILDPFFSDKGRAVLHVSGVSALAASRLLISARTDSRHLNIWSNSPHFDLAVSLVAPRYRYFRNRKSLFVGFCYELYIERKTITVDVESIQ